MLRITCINIFIVVHSSLGGVLFRSSPGDDYVTEAGLWGGRIGTKDKGQARNLYEYGLTSIQTESVVMEGIDISRLSFDPMNKEILMEVGDLGIGGFVARSSLCPNQTANVDILAGNVRLVDDDNPFLMDNDCGWKCGWNAFTQYGGQVYFLLSVVYGDHVANLRRHIEVRKLQNCFKNQSIEDITAVTEVNIQSCSTLVATLYSQNYAKPNPELLVWSGGAMTAIQAPGDDPDHHIHLYVQLFNRTTKGMKMTLVQIAVNDDSEGRAVDMLYSTHIESIYGGQWQFRGVGETTYKEGILCWTATEILLCGRLEGSKLSDVTEMLQPGEAHNLGICDGPTEPIPLGRVLTGVAIGSSSDPFSVYFGCISESSGIGGAGLLRLSVSYSGVQREIVPVTSNGQRVLAGAMFLVENLTDMCESEQTSTELPSAEETSDCRDDMSTHLDRGRTDDISIELVTSAAPNTIIITCLLDLPFYSVLISLLTELV